MDGSDERTGKRSRLGRNWRRWVLGLAALGLAGTVGVGVSLGVAYSRLGPVPETAKPGHSTVVLDRDGRLLRAFTTREGRWRLPVTSGIVDPRFLKLLVAYEDKRFFEHRGVDPLAMARAAWQLVSNGRVVSGASTITMQVARLIEPRPKRSLSAKLRQMLRAVQLERAMTKSEILTLYLTLAPYGGNLEGIRAAALAYFGKEPQRLNADEAALLVALPQSPEVRRPDRYYRRAREARDRVLLRGHAAGVFSLAAVEAGKARDVPKARKRFPQLAAHVARDVMARAPDRSSHRLTLDRELQTRLEVLAREKAVALGPRHSLAILVLDHKTGDVRAHVGSAGFLDSDRSGHIDMTRAVRSPGSTLKPIIYGMAFDVGLAHPETLIDDRPARFGTYAPRNFDKIFQGTVTVREALQRSLNVPAVKVMHAFGPLRFAARLERAGTPLALPVGQKPGLAVALGGTGLRLADLARLYAAIARGGEPVRLRYSRTGKIDWSKTEKARLLSPVSAWYLSDILRATPAPTNAMTGRIAFKTGTSYGYRDAWAVGFDGRHTIAVWAGRPDGMASPGLSGILTAAPILHDAFSRLGDWLEPLPTAPRGSVIATTAALPPPLRYFGADQDTGLTASGAAPKIAFPPNGAEVAVADDSGERTALAFKAEGGRLPLTWFANGVPLTSQPRRRTTFWQPDGKGFVRLTVMDRAGRTDSVTFRVARE